MTGTLQDTTTQDFAKSLRVPFIRLSCNFETQKLKVIFPADFLPSISDAPGFDEKTFESVHLSGEQVTAIRINPSKPVSPDHFSIQSQVPWASRGYYLTGRPSFTFDPLFHAGTYYVQDASSMFLEQALKQTVDLTADIRVLDLCAAPGGKSTHIQSLISPASLLVSNEVIRARGNILRDNIIKWGTSNVVVSHNDPAQFAALEGYFDVMVIDAPCSGSGLFRKDPEAMDAWSLQNVQLCCQRQQRILADAWPAIKPGGVLIYATCSYAPEEDEQISQWIVSGLGADFIPVQIPADWGIVETEFGYRFWPHLVKGEGFFLSCFRKNEAGHGHENHGKIAGRQRLTEKEKAWLDPWITGDFDFIRNGDFIFGHPEKLATDFAYLQDRLRSSYAGILLGEFAREKLIPSHALAMNPLQHPSIVKFELSRDQAIRYLQKKDIGIQPPGRGWQLMTFDNKPLGWANVLPNRINNYYPKELRIIKDI